MDLLAKLLKPENQITEVQRIYTISCKGREVTELPKLLTELDAILVDVRFSPNKASLEWRKDYLKLLLKKSIYTFQALETGNRE
jgi:hypothetical protein